MITIFILTSIFWVLFTFALLISMAGFHIGFNSKAAASAWILIMFLVTSVQIISGLSGFYPS